MIRTYTSTALGWKEHQIPQAGVASPPSCCREATPGPALSPQGKPVPALRFQVQGTGSHVSGVAPSMLSSQSCPSSFFSSEKGNLGGPGFSYATSQEPGPRSWSMTSPEGVDTSLLPSSATQGKGYCHTSSGTRQGPHA